MKSIRVLLAATVVLVAAACSGDDTVAEPEVTEPVAETTVLPPATDPPATEPTSTEVPVTEPPTTEPARPDGPAADVSEEITGANAPFLASAAPPDLAALGYEEHEYVAAGSAVAYTVVGHQGGDGRWTFESDGEADYRTRIVVRRPSDPATFSGTVLVEWLNVSSGLDADPDFGSLYEDITRNGDIWIGVSAQLLGVEGGPVLVSVPGAEALVGKGLKSLDPERYASLDHPGDGFSFDIFTQVARAAKNGGEVLGGVTPSTVLAAGESQSAIALTTYINGVQPLTQAFDGFYVHSRSSVWLPLVGPGEFADLAGGLGMGKTILREDTAVPVMDIQAESDLVGVLASAESRQDDTDTFRLWEVAGTSHADTRTLGPMAAGLDCGGPINDGPMHVVTKAAYRALVTWVVDGVLPPEAPRIALTADGEIERDADGIAVGGIRTPSVDVPVQVLSGESGGATDLICLLLGSTRPMPDGRIAELYPNADGYLTAYDTATDEVIDSGFVLEADRDALSQYARPELVTG